MKSINYNSHFLVNIYYFLPEGNIFRQQQQQQQQQKMALAINNHAPNHGRTRSIAACSKPRFTGNQEMSNCPTDGTVCPPKKYRNKWK